MTWEDQLCFLTRWKASTSHSGSLSYSPRPAEESRNNWTEAKMTKLPSKLQRRRRQQYLTLTSPQMFHSASTSNPQKREEKKSCIKNNKDVLLNKYWSVKETVIPWTLALRQIIQKQSRPLCVCVCLCKEKKSTFTCSLWISLHFSLTPFQSPLCRSLFFSPSCAAVFRWKADVFQHALDCSYHCWSLSLCLTHSHTHTFSYTHTFYLC